MTQSLVRVLLACFAFAAAACECDNQVFRQVPELRVLPEDVHLTSVPVAQDTTITFTLPNNRLTRLTDIQASFLEGSDPAFFLSSDVPKRVDPATSETFTVTVRPLTVGTITARLIVTATEEAVPNEVIVPIVVEAVDAGLPDIETTPSPDDCIDFNVEGEVAVGRGSIGRRDLVIQNVGVRDLILDDVEFVPADRDTADVLSIIDVRAGYAMTAGDTISIPVTFAPTDTLVHRGTILIRSNDPDENPVEICVRAQAVECPVAVIELLEDPEDIEPNDTVRLESRLSEAGVDGLAIDRAEWSIEIRPIGSTTFPSSPDARRTELTVDLAGEYVVRLDVFDTAGVRSCEPALLPIRVIPKEELLVQLVWDHPSADFDLHMVREGGEIFTHEGDVYFSNREPEDAPWSENPDENPVLDLDDDRGYGPENTNIVAPAAQSRWNVYVHYWNKQTDGDATATATIRVFAYGQQQLEVSQVFSTDQTLWRAVEIVWPVEELALPLLSPIGTTEPFARPF